MDDVPPTPDWSKYVTPRPALHWVAADAPGFTKIGGYPDAPPGFAWPIRAEHEASAWDSPFKCLMAKLLKRPRPIIPARPLPFIAQIDLAQAARQGGDAFGDGPRTGALYFFHNEREDPYAPAAVATRPEHYGWRVVYAESIETTQPLAVPGGSEPVPAVYKERFYDFKPIQTWPFGPEMKGLDALGEDWIETYYEDANEVYGGQPEHQLFGYPAPVQEDDMENECRADAPWWGPGAGGDERWRLLLQVDSDGDFCWGDAGKLYYWIREDDWRARRFDRTWLLMQCG